MNAAMERFLQQAEAGRVVVEAGQAEQRDRDDPSGRRQERPESHFRIEFGLELLDLGFVEFCHSRCAPADRSGYFTKPISL